MPRGLRDDLDEIEQQARDGISQVGYSEMNWCHKCHQAKWIRHGVHEVASALWKLRQIVRSLKSGEP